MVEWKEKVTLILIINDKMSGYFFPCIIIIMIKFIIQITRTMFAYETMFHMVIVKGNAQGG